MYKTWTSSAGESGTVARDLEAHLNEFADEVISVSYAVADLHYVLAVYRPIDSAGVVGESVAVSAVEHILGEAQG